MRATIGVDVGTTGVRAVLVTEEGEVAAGASRAYPVDYPRPGWAEQDPEAWRRAATEAVREVAGRARALGHAVVALGLTGQMHGAVLLDAQGVPIRPALIWCDQRSADEAEELQSRYGAEIVRLTANPALPNFTLTKLLWVRRHEPEAYARIRRVLLPKDYLRFAWTREAATDVADASGTLLLDVGRRRWSEEMAQLAEVPLEWLPRVHESPDVTGGLTAQAAAELDLEAGLPVVAGAGDQAAGAVSTGTVHPGILSTSLGTSGVLFATTDDLRPDPRGRLHAFCHAVPGRWHLMGVTQAAGGSLQWARRVLGRAEEEVAARIGADPYELLCRAAEQAPPGAEGLFFLPYLMGERTPHLDPLARGAWIGLTPRHDARHLLRAVLEGVTFSLRDVLEVMRELGLHAREARATGGGARSPLWRRLQADILGLPVVRLNHEEGPALGAALLAQVGAGLAASVEEACARAVRPVEVLAVDEEARRAYEERYATFCRLYPALRELFPLLADRPPR